MTRQNGLPIAHIRTDGTEQMLLVHLTEVGHLASDFADKLGVAEAGLVIGYLHDFGKYSQAFQNYLNSAEGRINPDEDEYIDAARFKGKIDHSTAGAQFIWTRISKVGKTGQWRLCAQILALCVASHHSGLINCLSEEGTAVFKKRMEKSEGDAHLDECMTAAGVDVVSEFDGKLSLPMIKQMFGKMQQIVEFDDVNNNGHLRQVESLALGLFTRFLFSCLIDADRLNSAEFEFSARKNVRLERNDWFEWSTVIERLERKLDTFDGTNPIDRIRRGISNDCLARSTDSQGTYTLTVPTGGGKTLASLRFALNHAKAHQLDRIIYIIPYTSIIDQNAEVVRAILEKPDDPFPVVLEHHSNVEPEKETWLSKLAAENWDAPIVFTTMVQFLEVLFGAGTRGARRFHQLSRSVLIFDEVQTVPINCIHLFCNAVNFFVRHAKSTAVLCTATQPVLDKLRFEEKGALEMAMNSELIADKSQLFADLTRVELHDKTRHGGWSDSALAEFTLGNLNKYGSCLVIVNTKDWAQRLYTKCRDLADSGAVFHLSTHMYPAHRRAILAELRQRLDDGLPTICISTQLIEAGVDISFASVVRFMAGMDSIAQAAGRCNRSGELKSADGKPVKGQVYIVNADAELIDLLPDIKEGQRRTRQLISEFPAKEWLSYQAMERYFQLYYFDRAGEMSYQLKSGSRLRDDNLINMLANNTLNPGGRSRSFVNKQGWQEVPLLQQSFMDAARAFKAIDAPTESVIVRCGEGKDIVNRLCSLDPRRQMPEYVKAIKAAQQYSVNVFPNVWKKLIELKAVHETQEGEGIYYVDPGFYSEQFGLSTSQVGTSAEYYFD